MKHYVYYHIDPIDGQVKYIGKGSGYRAYEIRYRRNSKHLKWLKDLEEKGLVANIKIAFRFESELEAYKKEKELIAQFRANGVSLFNMLPGGDPMCGSNNPMYGKKRPDKSEWNKLQKGKSLEELYGDRANDIRAKRSNKGRKNGMFGRKRPDLTKRNRDQAGMTYEEIFGREKADSIRLKLGGTRILRSDGVVFYSINSAAKSVDSTKYLLNRHLGGYIDLINNYTFQRLDSHPIDPGQS